MLSFCLEGMKCRLLILQVNRSHSQDLTQSCVDFPAQVSVQYPHRGVLHLLEGCSDPVTIWDTQLEYGGQTGQTSGRAREIHRGMP